MNKLSELTETLAKNSKQQANDIEQHLQKEFERHKQTISAVLNENEKKIKSDINAQNRRLSASILKTWLWLAMSVMMLLGALQGVLWWQGNLIEENWQTISKQNENIRQLEAKGGKIQMTTCGKKQRLCVKINKEAGQYGDSKTKEYPWMIPEGY